ncbi:MAG: hypothetical protein KC431_05455, partial [Myxococcales bacterium]|nr:hypothetical protein [Myxococcales bacterium]
METGGSLVRRGIALSLLGALITAIPLLLTACPEPGADPEMVEGEHFVVRLEFVLGTELPEGARGIHAQLSSVDVHLNGGWIELPWWESELFAPAGGTTLVGRFVLTPDELRAQSFRIRGEFSLDTVDGFLRVTPERDLQINLANQRLVANAVNHVRVDLTEAFSSPGPHEWTLDATHRAQLEVHTANFTSAEATPEQGASLVLDNGFEIEIPPGAVATPQVVHVERVETDGWPYYLTGPDGTQFVVPITVKYPPDGEFEEAAVAWDGARVHGVHDQLGRVVVQNDHFCCIDDPTLGEHEALKVDGEGNPVVTKYSGTCCGADFSVVYVDIGHDNIELSPLIAPRSEKTPSTEYECDGQALFDATPVSSTTRLNQSVPQNGLLQLAIGSFPGYTPLIALNGDNAESNESSAHVAPSTICFRDLTVVNGETIQAKVDRLYKNPLNNFYGLEFDFIKAGGTHFEVSQDLVSNGLRHAFTSGFRSIHDGKADNILKYKDELINGEPSLVVESEINVEFCNHRANYGKDECKLFRPLSRASYGLSQDERYLIMAVGNGDYADGMTLQQWRNVVQLPRTMSKPLKEGEPVPDEPPIYVSPYNLFRTDGGHTVELAHLNDANQIVAVKGSMQAPRGTNFALGVFWRDAKMLPLTCDEEEKTRPRYGDVPLDEWFHEPVTKLMCAGSIDNALAFWPYKDTSRVEYLKALLELAFPDGDFDNIDVKDFNVYADVSPSQWFSPYVKFAHDLDKARNPDGQDPNAERRLLPTGTELQPTLPIPRAEAAPIP